MTVLRAVVPPPPIAFQMFMVRPPALASRSFCIMGHLSPFPADAGRIAPASSQLSSVESSVDAPASFQSVLRCIISGPAMGEISPPFPRHAVRVRSVLPGDHVSGVNTCPVFSVEELNRYAAGSASACSGSLRTGRECSLAGPAAPSTHRRGPLRSPNSRRTARTSFSTCPDLRDIRELRK